MFENIWFNVCHGDNHHDRNSSYFSLGTYVNCRNNSLNSIKTVIVHIILINMIGILIRSNKMQQYAGVYLLQNHSTCFGCLSHPSSGVHKTVTAASGTDHSIWATAFLQRGQLATLEEGCCSDTMTCTKAAVTILCTPDVWCDGHPKHVEWFCGK